MPRWRAGVAVALGAGAAVGVALDAGAGVALAVPAGTPFPPMVAPCTTAVRTARMRGSAVGVTVGVLRRRDHLAVACTDDLGVVAGTKIADATPFVDGVRVGVAMRAAAAAAEPAPLATGMEAAVAVAACLEARTGVTRR